MKQWISFNKTYITFVFSSICGMLGSVGTIIADTYFISQQLGSKGLAALNIDLPIFGLLAGLGLMIAIGGGTRFTILKEQGQLDKANTSYTTAFYLASIMGGIFVISGIFFSRPFTHLLGASHDIFHLCHTYLTVILLCGPFFMFNYLWVVFIRNDGNPHYPMIAMIFNNIMNIILDYLFMYPLQMGIFGSALATGLSPLFGIGVSYIYFQRHHAGFKRTKGSMKESLAIISLGGNTFINEMSSSIVIFVFNVLMMKYSQTIGVAAYGVVANYALVMMYIFTGMAQGIQPLLSQARGQGDHDNMKMIYQTSLYLAVLLGIGSMMIIYSGTNSLVSFFNGEHHPMVQTMAYTGLRLYFIGFLLCGMNIVTTFLFSSLEKPRISLFLSLFRGCIGLIIIVIIMAHFWQVTGIWLSFIVTESVTLLLSLPFLYRYIYRK